jgi:hypothetical protein
MKKRHSGLLSILVLLLFGLSCTESNSWETRKAGRTMPENSKEPHPKSNSVANRDALEPALSGFSINVICSLPNQVATETPFAHLGGGSWGEWDRSGGELAYGCNGGKDQIWLVDDDKLKISAEYGVIGGVQTAHQVSAEYTALQYGGLTPAEKKWRNQYADFCDQLSKRFYGEKLPELFRKRLLNEAAYSTTGTSNEYAEKVASGYLNLSSNKNKTTVMLDVHFFSSEAEYEKYKDQ